MTPALRATIAGAAGSVQLALVQWVAVLTYQGEANIRIDVPIFAFLGLLTLAVAATAVLTRWYAETRHSSVGASLSTAAVVGQTILTVILVVALAGGIVLGDVPVLVAIWGILAILVGIVSQAVVLRAITRPTRPQVPAS